MSSRGHVSEVGGGRRCGLGPSWLGRHAAPCASGSFWGESASVVGERPSRRRVCPSLRGRWLCINPPALSAPRGKRPLGPRAGGRVPTPGCEGRSSGMASLLQRPGAASMPTAVGAVRLAMRQRVVPRHRPVMPSSGARRHAGHPPGRHCRTLAPSGAGLGCNHC